MRSTHSCQAARKLATQRDTTSGLVPQYDTVTSTESLFQDTPQSALQYSRVKPVIKVSTHPSPALPSFSPPLPDSCVPKDEVIILAGPDKGRVGVLLGIENDSGIVKLSTRELKVIDMEKIAKQLQ